MTEASAPTLARVAAIRNFLDGLECILSLLPAAAASRVREINTVVQGTSSGVQRVRLAARHVPELDALVAAHPEAAALLFYRGFLKRTAEDFPAACEDLTAALGARPEQAQGYFWRATALGALRRFEEAVEDLDRAIALAPNCAEYYKLRGQANEKARRLDAALRDFDRAIALDPKYDWAYIGRSMVHADLGRWQEALADLDAAVARNASEEWAFLKRSLVRRRLGDMLGAVRDVTKASELNPSCDWANANMPGHGGNLEEALSDIDAALREDPRDPWVRAWRGQTLMKARRLNEAEAELTTALGGELGKHRGWVLAWRGETRRLARRLQEAAGDLEEAARLAPAYPRVYLWRGRLALDQGCPEAAIPDFERAIELDDRMPEMHFYAGEAQRALGRLPEALRRYSHALKLNPTDERAFKARADVRSALGDEQGLIDDLLAAYEKVQIPPQEWRETREKVRRDGGPLADVVWRRLELPAQAWAGMAREALERADPAAALSECEQGLARAGLRDSWLLQAWRAAALRALGRPREAVAAASDALGQRPDCLLALALRGEALRDLGEGLRGSCDLAEALRRDPQAGFVTGFIDLEQKGGRRGPQDAWAYALGGAAARAGGAWERAEGLLRAAVGLDPAFAVAWGWLGELLLSRDEAEEARSALERARELLPGWPNAHLWEGLWLQRRGLHREAIARFDRSLDLGAAGCAVYLARAASHSALGDTQSQIRDFERAVRAEPGAFRAQAPKGGDASARFLRALLLKIRRAELWSGRAHRALERGDADAAARCVERAAQADPDGAPSLGTLEVPSP